MADPTLNGNVGLINELRGRLADAESTLRLVELSRDNAERRAALAQKSARDAWQFAQLMMRRPSRIP